MTDVDTLDKYVLCINECKSITGAAEKMGISQPAISSGLNSLEKKLGYNIFDRKKTPIVLTKEGQIYIEYVQAKIKLKKNLDSRIKDIADIGEKSITIGAPATYMDTVLLQAVDIYTKENKDCRIKLVESTVPSLSDKARVGDIDFFISTTKELPDQLVTEYISDEKIYLCVPKDYKVNGKQKSDKFDFSEITDEGFIFLAPNQPLQQEVDRYFDELGITVKCTLEVDQTKTAMALAKMGKGIFFASKTVLGKGSSKLQVYNLPQKYFNRKLYVAYEKNKYISKNIKRFIEILKSVQ